MRKIEYDATRARPWKRPKSMFRGRKKSIWNKKLNVNIRTHVQVVHPVLDQEYGMEEIEVFSQSHSYLSICIFSLSYSSSYFKYNIYENGMEEIFMIIIVLVNMHICHHTCRHISNIIFMKLVWKRFSRLSLYSSICIFVIILVVIFQI